MRYVLHIQLLCRLCFRNVPHAPRFLWRQLSLTDHQITDSSLYRRARINSCSSSDTKKIATAYQQFSIMPCHVGHHQPPTYTTRVDVAPFERKGNHFLCTFVPPSYSQQGYVCISDYRSGHDRKQKKNIIQLLCLF